MTSNELAAFSARPRARRSPRRVGSRRTSCSGTTTKLPAQEPHEDEWTKGLPQSNRHDRTFVRGSYWRQPEGYGSHARRFGGPAAYLSRRGPSAGLRTGCRSWSCFGGCARVHCRTLGLAEPGGPSREDWSGRGTFASMQSPSDRHNGLSRAGEPCLGLYPAYPAGCTTSCRAVYVKQRQPWQCTKYSISSAPTLTTQYKKELSSNLANATPYLSIGPTTQAMRPFRIHGRIERFVARSETGISSSDSTVTVVLVAQRPVAENTSIGRSSFEHVRCVRSTSDQDCGHQCLPGISNFFNAPYWAEEKATFVSGHCAHGRQSTDGRTSVGPYMTSRHPDNLMKADVDFSRSIRINGRTLQFLIESCFSNLVYRANCRYDLSQPMRRANS